MVGRDALAEEETERDVAFLALKIEEAAVSQGVRVALSWKRQGNRFSTKASKKERSSVRP